MQRPKWWNSKGVCRVRHRDVQPFVEWLEGRRLLTNYSLRTLASFNGTNGSSPTGNMVLDGQGNLYGTTTNGGAKGYGTVFEVAKGSNTITTLASFNGTNGNEPFGGVILDGQGNLYGTTTSGGAKGYGTVFEVAKGSTTITALASFNGSNGDEPFGGLVLDGQGNLYGTALFGGANGYGTVFEVAKGSTTITALASFDIADGGNPYDLGGLVLDGQDNLYGTTSFGGANDNYGTVFEIAKGSNTITVLASFNSADGGDPYSGTVLDSQGNLYGTTDEGGPTYYDNGTVFEVAKGSNAITTLASFNSTNGVHPFDGVILDGQGNLYGVTAEGGATGYGTVFEVAKGSNTITVLTSFNGTNGDEPDGGLVLDGQGNLYGTTGSGGANGYGTVFELSPPSLPALNLTEATTTDAQSVTVDYTISQAAITQPLEFTIYRSDQPELDGNSVYIGTQYINPSSDPQDLTVGGHAVTLLEGISLPPDPALPYVVVVANPGSSIIEDPRSVNTAYFQKYLLGIVVHGFLPSTTDETPAWETSMANDLVTIDHYNNAIAYNWVTDSFQPLPGLTVENGNELYQQVVNEADTLAAFHAGDVVDLHFIGHSRGADVVSQALQDLVGNTNPALQGSYIHVTLLDPHPANNNNGIFYSNTPNLLGRILKGIYLGFQSQTQDPPIILPHDNNIEQIEIYYQNTPYYDFNILKNPSEYFLNLWGEGPTAPAIINQSSTAITWVNLSGVDPILGPIGHTEVHEWYQLYVVDAALFADAAMSTGPRNRSALSRAEAAISMPTLPVFIGTVGISNTITATRVYPGGALTLFTQSVRATPPLKPVAQSLRTSPKTYGNSLWT